MHSNGFSYTKGRSQSNESQGNRSSPFRQVSPPVVPANYYRQGNQRSLPRNDYGYWRYPVPLQSSIKVNPKSILHRLVRQRYRILELLVLYSDLTLPYNAFQHNILVENTNIPLPRTWLSFKLHKKSTNWRLWFEWLFIGHLKLLVNIRLASMYMEFFV